MPQSVLLEKLVTIHKEFVAEMPYLFELSPNSVKPIQVRFGKEEKDGLFDPKIPEIIVNPDSYNEKFKEDILFTSAHESAHYLHYLIDPRFYPSSFRSYCEGSNINSFRDLVADIASFEFFRQQRLLPNFLSKTKKKVLRSWEESGGACHYPKLGNLSNYCIYKQLFDGNNLLETMKIEGNDTNSIRKFNELISETNHHLWDDPSNVQNIRAISYTRKLL